MRWNLSVLLLDVTFFALGMAFLDSSAVLPLLLERLGATGPVIGAFAALRLLAFSSLQVVVAYGTHGRVRQKPLLAWAATLTRLPLLALPWFLWRADHSATDRIVALAATIFLLSLWALGDGLGYVPWMEIVARAFPDRTRGRFFATTQLASGLMSCAIALLIVRYVLHSPRLPYPHNYALLAGASALMFQISLLGVLLIREPPVPPDAPLPLPSPADYARQLPVRVRANPIFARLASIQLLSGFGAAAAPFYVLYATHTFRLGDEWGATYQVLQAIGTVALMPVWTLLSERCGPGAAVRGVALTCLLTPLLALTLGTLSPWLFGLVFLLMGGSLGWTMWIVINHFLLSHIAANERTTFVALLNLLFMPSALYPFLGGLLVPHEQLVTLSGRPLLFLLTALVVAAGFVLALRLPAPEGRLPQD